MSALHLRPYRPEDEAATIDLWHRTWQQTYPQIDFAARLEWWRERWRKDLVPKAAIVVAEQNGALTGFVTIDGDGYLDQLVVDPAHWGSDAARLLVDELRAKSRTETLPTYLPAHHAVGSRNATSEKWS